MLRWPAVEILLSHSGGAAFGRVEREATRSAADAASARACIAARARQPAVGAAVAGACLRCDRPRTFPRILLGGPLADIAAARARNRPDHFRPAGDRGGAAAGDPAAAERQRRAATPRSPQRRNTPAGDGRFRSHCCKRKRSGGAGPLAGACRARAAVRAQDQGRLADAAAVAARSDGVARARVHFDGGDVLRGERRAVQACRRRLRLARRGRAGEFPDRCVDHAAGLHRTAAGDAARPAAG